MKWPIVLLLAAAAPVQRQTTEPVPVNFTAKSANVGESVPIKINIFRWSTDEERNPIVLALDPAAQAAAQAAAAGGRGGRGAAGGGRGGRGGGRGDQAAAGVDPDDPAMADVPTGRGGRGGGGGRGGRGGGGDAAPAKPPDPIALFTAALGKAPTVGYLWTNEVAGYSIKYAFRTSLPNSGERIILVTDRRLGGGTAAWKPASGSPTDYEFTVIEIRMDSKGTGEGKSSLNDKIVLEKDSKTVALESYATTPVILQNVMR